MVNANDMSRGGSIRNRRRILKLSQQRLAEVARCSVSMVRLLEAGYVPAPDSAVAARIASALGTHPGALFLSDDTRPAEEPGAVTTSAGRGRGNER